MDHRHRTTRRALLALAAASTATAVAPRLAAAAEPAYPLDELSRRVPRRGPLKCPDVELVDYRGKHLRYTGLARVYEGFAERLARMEQVACEAGTAVYGRPPRRLQHMGTYACRRISAYPTWLSEHALGNAIDLEGFDFGPVPRGEALPDDVPSVLRGYFSVRLARHWSGSRGYAKLHARFLRTFARRLIARKDIFRVLLGPSYPGHHNHFHLDAAPWRIVDVFEDEPG
ncbi:MAG: extensin family protein [Deltaproteobacteria bacterium]|nr:extensin family protein [Deltaproteobacteria bacterium]